MLKQSQASVICDSVLQRRNKSQGGEETPLPARRNILDGLSSFLLCALIGKKASEAVFCPLVGRRLQLLGDDGNGLRAKRKRGREKKERKRVWGLILLREIITTFLQFPAYKVIVGSRGPPDSTCFQYWVFPHPHHPELPPLSNPPNPIPTAREFPPHWPWTLTSTGLSNTESGDPQAANNNFSS